MTAAPLANINTTNFHSPRFCSDARLTATGIDMKYWSLLQHLFSVPPRFTDDVQTKMKGQSLIEVASRDGRFAEPQRALWQNLWKCNVIACLLGLFSVLCGHAAELIPPINTSAFLSSADAAGTLITLLITFEKHHKRLFAFSFEDNLKCVSYYLSGMNLDE